MLDDTKLPIRRSNMTLLRSLTLRCASCDASGSGPQYWAMAMPADADGAKLFLAGYDKARKVEL